MGCGTVEDKQSAHIVDYGYQRSLREWFSVVESYDATRNSTRVHTIDSWVRYVFHFTHSTGKPMVAPVQSSYNIRDKDFMIIPSQIITIPPCWMIGTFHRLSEEPRNPYICSAKVSNVWPSGWPKYIKMTKLLWSLQEVLLWVPIEAGLYLEWEEVP